MPPPDFAWGKYCEPDQWLSLCDHMGDVADCFKALIGLPLFRARLTEAIGHAPDEVTVERLCVLAWLHDVGKLGSTFQARARDPAVRAGHTAQGWQIFSTEGEAVARALNLPEIEEWGDAAFRLFLAALAHHGRPINGADIPRAADWKPRDGYDPVQAAAVLGAACRARYGRAFGPGAELPDSPELQHFFAGMVALADQIGSRETDFPLDRHMAVPRDPAEVLKSLRLDVAALREAYAEHPAHRLFGWKEGTALRPMQQALADLPLGVRLAVLESETGSGKTEVGSSACAEIVPSAWWPIRPMTGFLRVRGDSPGNEGVDTIVIEVPPRARR